jgi:hypothetical protein
MSGGRFLPHRWIVISVLVFGSRFTAGGRLLGHRTVAYIRRCWAELQAITDTSRIHDVSIIRGQTSEVYKKKRGKISIEMSSNSFRCTAFWPELDFYKWGHLKTPAYPAQKGNEEIIYHRNTDVCQTIRTTPESLRQSMIRRAHWCVDFGRRHCEHLGTR